MENVGQFALIGRVAKTHSSTIWKAHDPALDRFVALKQLSAGLNEEVLHREAQILAALDHPHIVHVIDVITDQGRLFLVEEWVEGASLGAVRDHSGELTPAQAVGVIRGALQGLAHAHDHDVVHGDISPGNILIDTAGTSKLIDFGSASFEPATLTSPNRSAGSLQTGLTTGSSTSQGTVGYRSPEVAGGDPSTKRSDVYAAAAVLADLLTADRPAVAEVPDQLRGVNDVIAAVLRTALSTNPAGRQPDAAALLRELEQAADRILGAGWLGVAGMSGLVSATLGAGGVALITTETTAGTATMVAAAGSTRLGPTVKQSKKWMGAAAAAAAAIAIIVTGTVLITSHHTAAAPPVMTAAVTSPTSMAATTRSVTTTHPVTTVTTPPPPTPTPLTTQRLVVQPQPARATLKPGSTSTSHHTASKVVRPAGVGFNGTYQTTDVTTKVDNFLNPTDHVGQTTSNIWKVTSPCKTAACGASVVSDSGRKFRFTDKAGVYTQSTTTPSPCLDGVSGQPNGDVSAVTVVYTLRPRLIDGTVVALSGTLVERQTGPLCPNQTGGAAEEDQTLTVTRQHS